MNHHDTREQLANTDFTRHRVLCKFRGMLVIAEVTLCDDGNTGSCPECGSTKFSENAGWTECDCGFAYLTEGLSKIASTAEQEAALRAEFEAWILINTEYLAARTLQGKYASVSVELAWQAFLKAKRG